jgi:hypothetical protein
MAYTHGIRQQGQGNSKCNPEKIKDWKASEFRGRREILDYANGSQRKGNQRPQREQSQYSDSCSASWWSIEPDVGRVAHGVAARVDRLKAIGNGQVPAVAAEAFMMLSAFS